MTSPPETHVLQADLRFCIDLPEDYGTWSADDQRALRRRFKEQVAHHPEESDDEVGNEKGTRACDVERGEIGPRPDSCEDAENDDAENDDQERSASRAWIAGDLVTATGYPDSEELIAFVSARLDAYNSVFRTDTNQLRIDVAALGPVASGPTDPGPTDPEPRAVRYVLVCGRLKCIAALQLVERVAMGDANAQAAPFAIETQAGGQTRRLPIVAEVTFGRPHP